MVLSPTLARIGSRSPTMGSKRSWHGRIAPWSTYRLYDAKYKWPDSAPTRADLYQI